MRLLGSRASQVIKAGLGYFALVFAAGFVLGTVRVALLVPSLGERTAELVEMPFMLVAIVLSASFVVRRFALPRATSVRVSVGLLALGLLLGAEFLLAAAIQERSVGEYVASRDPVSGAVYLAALVVFALMPLILARRESMPDATLRR